MGINLRLAWRNIWRHPRRTLLTLAAIIFSDAILVWMIGLQLGQYDLMIDNTMRAFSGHIQIQANGYLDKPQIRKVVPSAETLAEQIRQNPLSKNTAVRAMGFALASSEKRSYGAQVIGVQPEFENKVSIIPGLVKQGRYLSNANTLEAVIGSVMARNLKLKLDDELTLLGSGKDGSIAAAVVKIVGIFNSGLPDMDRYFVQIPLNTFQDIFAMDENAHSIAIAAVNHQQTKVVMQQVMPIVAEFNNDLEVVDWEQMHPGLKQAIQADFSTAWLMYGVLVILVAFSVLNTFLMSVLERTREFGIMLALGLTPGKVGRLVIHESILLSLCGLTLGIIFGSLLTYYFVVHGFSYPGMEDMAARFNLPDRIYPVINPMSLLLGPGVIFIATILAAVYPAVRIHLLKPVDAMQTV